MRVLDPWCCRAWTDYGIVERSLLLLAEQELIVLLCLEESLLEVVGVYVALALMPSNDQMDRRDSLSLLAKRMASV